MTVIGPRNAPCSGGRLKGQRRCVHANHANDWGWDLAIAVTLRWRACGSWPCGIFSASQPARERSGDFSSPCCNVAVCADGHRKLTTHAFRLAARADPKAQLPWCPAISGAGCTAAGLLTSAGSAGGWRASYSAMYVHSQRLTPRYLQPSARLFRRRRCCGGKTSRQQA